MFSLPITPSWLRVFAIDLRSLAAFRIALGLLMLASLVKRGLDFQAFHTEDGVWPLAAVWQELRWPAGWSLHILDGSTSWQVTLAACEALAAVALLLGWRTRVFAVIAWVLVVSVQRRNMLLVSGAETLLRLMLFWGMWLPLGARWSLDARRRGSSPGEGAVLSVASAALLLQIALVYVFNAIYKSDPAWRSTGEAIWMALSEEANSRPAGRAMLAWPGVLRAMTFFVLALEAFGPVPAIIPWRNARWRILVAGAFLSFHAGLAVTMRLGVFPFVGMMLWLPFLPSEVWRGTAWKSIPFVRQPWPINAAAGLCLAGMVCWNLQPWVPWLMPAPVKLACQALRLEQRWSMFAPKPHCYERWIVVVGTDASGRETNLMTGESPVNWRRPRDFAEFFASHNWRIYYTNFRRGGPHRKRIFADWISRKWRAEHPEAAPFVKMEIYCLTESIYRRNAVPENYLDYEDPPSEEPVKAQPEPAAETPVL